MPAAVDIIKVAAPEAGNHDVLVKGDTKHYIHSRGSAVNDFPPEKPYSICLDTAPVTVGRLPYYPKEGDKLQDPGTARVSVAASNEAPHGTQEGNWAKDHSHQTVLTQHCAYWDKDNDGVIWPIDTYRGVRAWGWNPLLSFIAAFIINVNLSYPTCPTWIPDPAFRLWINRMHKNKHGSDSMTYDNEGRFRPQQFEDIFAKYDRDKKGGLDVWDLLSAHKGQRMAMDFWGWSATFLEWLATYLLIWPEDGVLRKEDVRRVFDGSIFQWKADEYAEKQRLKAKQGQKRLS